MSKVPTKAAIRKLRYRIIRQQHTLPSRLFYNVAKGCFLQRGISSKQFWFVSQSLCSLEFHGFIRFEDGWMLTDVGEELYRRTLWK